MPAAPQSHIRILPHIRRAIDAGGPVVALESSVFAQGLPQPQNAEAAQRMVAAVERTGAVPAVTAVVCGRPSLGLESAEMERFLLRDGIHKVSARDLGASAVQRHDGATTVAASLAIASLAGVRVLATGGIGGVHRQLPDATPSSWIPDESADLHEMARTPMVIVCAGAKSILDLRATWERLDTLGIPVIGLGTREFPGFFSASSGIPLTTIATTADEVAEIAAAHFGLGRVQSVLVVQPPPAEVALDAELVERAVRAALERAATQNVRGSEVTPYVLGAVSRETGGRTLQTNLGLLEANARQAASIAVAWSRMARDRAT